MSKSRKGSGDKPRGKDLPAAAHPNSAAVPPAVPAKLPAESVPPRLNPAPLAYENPSFLNSADGRLIRIVAEFMEPLARFRREQIQDTVVFFGSARFRGKEEADHELELLENTGSAKPAPSEEQPARPPEIAAGRASELQRKRAVAAVQMARYYEDARRLANMFTSWAKTIPSRRHRFVVTSGGGPGIMEAANRGAFEHGGTSVGLNVSVGRTQVPNAYTTLPLHFHYFFVRKVMLVKYASAFFVMPGGLGTLDELFEALTLIQTHKVAPFPVVLLGKDYWSGLIAWLKTQVLAQGLVSPQDLNLFHVTDDIEEAVGLLGTSGKAQSSRQSR